MEEPLSRWKWAWSRRRVFGSILNPAIGGGVLGALRAAYPALAGRSGTDWAAIAVQGVLLALVTAFMLPIAETVYRWLTYPRVRAESEVARLTDLLASTEEARHALQQRLEVRPHLKLREPGAVHTDDITFFNLETGQPLWTGNFLHVRFVNEPPHYETSAVARDIAAKITFAQGGKVLKTIDGRWAAGADQPALLIAQAKSTVPLLRRDFNIGDEDNVDIAFKLVADDLCYMFNTDSFRFVEGKIPEFALGPGTYDVTVRLVGVRVNEMVQFSFTNPGAGKRFLLGAASDSTKDRELS
jgi:hypothetical protein